MSISTVLTPPSRTQTAEAFASTMDAFLGDLPTWTTEANELQADVNAKHVIASAAAISATASAEAAASSAVMSSANANFKGAWSALTGALAVPASVLHAGKNWQLIDDLADVTASEPGVSADWVEMKAGGGGEAGRIEISANYTVTSDTPKKVIFIPTTSGLVVTMPTEQEADGTPYIISNGGGSSFTLMSETGYVIKSVGAEKGFILIATGSGSWVSFPLESLGFLVPGEIGSPELPSVFESATTSHTSVTALSSDKAVVAYRDEGNSNYGTACVLGVF